MVDSSVWIDYFRAADTPQVALLDSYLGRVPLAVGDLIAAEVLQGVRAGSEFKRVKRTLDAFDHIDLVSERWASRSGKPLTRLLLPVALKTG